MDQARLRAQYSMFVEEMTAWREERGWSQAELARRTGYTDGLINHVTAYRRAPTMALAEKLDDVFKTAGYRPADPEAGIDGTPGTFQRQLLKLSTGTFSVPFSDFVPHEQGADELYICEHSYIPGLFQNAEYAECVLSVRPNTTRDELDNMIQSRLQRQGILTRGDAPIVWALVDEGVLYRPIASPAVMHAQLTKLLEIGELPNVTINILPYAGNQIGLHGLGAFTIAEAPGQPTVVNLEDASDGRVADDSPTIVEMRLRWKTLASMALPVAGSREIMRKALGEKWTQ